MASDPKTINLKGMSQADVNTAINYIHAIEPGAYQPATDRYVKEVYRLEPDSGLAARVVVSQFSVRTGAGTSPSWRTRLNPAGIGMGDVRDLGYSWDTPEHAAQGHLVHLSAYVDGYNRNLRRMLDQDPGYYSFLKTDYPESVKVVSDLIGSWATDPQYGTKIAWRLDNLRLAVPTPTPPPPGPKPPGPVAPPPLVWVGTNNFHQRPLGVGMIRFWVHHITDDMVLSNVISWFKNPASRASSTFVIDRDGTIYQMLRTGVSPWTNGDIEQPRKDIPALNQALAQVYASGYNLNDYCVTTEYVGTPTNPPTEAQYQAGIALCQYGQGMYNIPPHRFGQLRHSDINSVERSYCPGPHFDLTRIIQALGGDPGRLQ